MDHYLWLFCEDLWVINGILTNKNVFSTNRVVYMVGCGDWSGSKRQSKKIRDFMAKELLGIRIMEGKFTWLIKNFTNDLF